jgi:hypothetical protein
LVNISLLTKWRWQLLSSHDSLWKSVLKAKYGGCISFSPDLFQWKNVKFASLWWRDLCCLGRMRSNEEGDWCCDIMIKKLGSGGNTKLWIDNWVGNTPLCKLFPRLFLVSSQTDNCVNQMGEWRDGVWCWKLNWRRNLFVWEGELLVQLLELLRHINLSLVDDSWKCEIGADGEYSVKDGYFFLAQNFLPPRVWNGVDGSVVKRVWVSLAPSKIVIFSWQLLLQRLPTRANLSRRRVLCPPSQSVCVWCHSEAESENHLFATCRVAVEVWVAIYAWLGLTTVVPGCVSLSFETFGFPFRGKKRIKGLTMIWQTAT